jgi:imidazolonepropionase-like amidohydrolase
MGMTPAEAVHAATRGGAAALDRDDVGVLAPGRSADLVLLDAPSYLHLAYRPGGPRTTVLRWTTRATQELPQTPVVRRPGPRLR